jgi:hypothetical protein
MGSDDTQDVLRCKEIIIGGKGSTGITITTFKLANAGNINGSNDVEIGTYNNSGFIKIYDDGVSAVRILPGSPSYLNIGAALAIGANSANANSLCEFTSTTQAVVMPRMTTAQGATLSGAGVISGAVIYDTTLKKLKVFTDGGWETITSVSGG